MVLTYAHNIIINSIKWLCFPSSLNLTFRFKLHIHFKHISAWVFMLLSFFSPTRTVIPYRYVTKSIQFYLIVSACLVQSVEWIQRNIVVFISKLIALTIYHASKSNCQIVITLGRVLMNKIDTWAELLLYQFTICIIGILGFL